MIRPFRDQVLVRRDDSDAVTTGGIVIPEIARMPCVRGTVEAVGPGRFSNRDQRIDPTVRVGDVVLFARDGGTSVTTEDGPRLLISEGEIMAIRLPSGDLRLLLDRVLLQREIEVASGTIVRPEAYQKKPLACRVIATGPGRQLPDGSFRPCTVTPGDRVMLQEWTPDIEVHGETMTIAGELEILLKLGASVRCEVA